MIQPQDLRIGNKIYYGEPNKSIITVESIGKTGINGENIGEYLLYFDEYKYEHLEPIPLSGEILEKCGFEQSIENNFILNDFRVWIDPQTKRVFIFCNRKILDDSVSLRLEKKYLHQLQNLYYDLTGEELNVQFDSYTLPPHTPSPNNVIFRDGKFIKPEE